MQEDADDYNELKRSRSRGRRGRGRGKDGKVTPQTHKLMKLNAEALAQRVRAAGGLKGLPIVTIDFESFFACQPSEVALACVALGEGGAVQHLAHFHAFVGPSFDPAKLPADQRSAMNYVQSRVTGIPFDPPLAEARYDYGALLGEILDFVKKHDRLGVLLAKACQMEVDALLWLMNASGVTVQLPLLGECEDLIEHVLERPLASQTFNVFVRDMAFKLEDCCEFHADRNKARAKMPNREPYHCALQDAKSFGDIMVTANMRLDRLEAVDAVEREKDRIRAEEMRLKREEEQLLATPMSWVFRCRDTWSLYVGRSPRNARETEELEQLGVTCCATMDADHHVLLDSDLGIVPVRYGLNMADIETSRRVLLDVLTRDGESVLLCAEEVRLLRDLYHAFRLIDCHRAKRQVETEWRMLTAALPPTNREVLYCDARLLSNYVHQLTVCPDFNNAPFCPRGNQCLLRHVCSFCKSDKHKFPKCKERNKKAPVEAE